MSGAARLLCCCDEDCDGVECSDCGEVIPPDSFTVTFDDVVLDAGCYTHPDNSLKIKLNPAFVLDGTYCVEQVSPCCWTLTLIGEGASYYDGPCDDIDPVTGPWTQPIVVWISRFDGAWHVYVGVSDNASSVTAILFYNRIEVPCNEGGSASNDAGTVGDIFDGPIDETNGCVGSFYFPTIMASDGTVTITPCC